MHSFKTLLLLIVVFCERGHSCFAQIKTTSTITTVDTLILGNACESFSPQMNEFTKSILGFMQHDSTAVVSGKSLLVFREFDKDKQLVRYIEIPNKNFNSIFVQSQKKDGNFYPYYWVCEICFNNSEEVKAAVDMLNPVINHDDEYNSPEDYFMQNGSRLIYFKSGNEKISSLMHRSLQILEQIIHK